MSTPDVLGPFRPGFGGSPPYLAGREDEQEALRRYGSAVADGVAPGTAVILYGPRGNGKTVLLRWLEEEAARSLPGLDVLHLTPAGIGNVAQLAERIAPRSWLERIPSGEVTLPVVAATLRWGREGGPLPPPEHLLEARARSRPFVLMVDEAHTLDPGVGQALLTASQIAAGKHPFLLVLAGTPELPERLRDMDASFWARAAKLRIGRLAADAAGEAIRIPLASRNVGIGDDLLASIVRDCHGYPYFIQVWGDAVWREVGDGLSEERPTEVTSAHLSSAGVRFGEEKDAYYVLRYREIADAELLPVARSVAEAFAAAPRADRSAGGVPTLTDSALSAAIERGLGGRASPERTTTARGRLDRLGYIWGTDRRPAWEPGIPSLMDYVLRYAPATGT